MEIKNFIATLCLVFYPCTLTNADEVGIPSGRIFNGDEVADCVTHPWHAHINSEFNLVCGGTLISDRFVLTAAHCTDCTAGSNYRVYLGSVRILQGIEHNGILLGCYGGSYNVSFDVAIIELAAPIAITVCIDYVSILDKRDFIEDNILVKAIGFGTTETGDTPIMLQEATFLRTMNQRECEMQYAFIEGLLESNLCTYSDRVGHNLCTGDSGGGLYFDDDGLRPVLIGVINGGPTPCNYGDVAVYAKVNHPLIFDWIMDMTNNTVNYVAIHTNNTVN